MIRRERRMPRLMPLRPRPADDASRVSLVHSAQRVGRHRMVDQGFRLFPVRASSMAGEVDALLFFCWRSRRVMTLGIAAAIVFLAFKYRRGSKANRQTGGATAASAGSHLDRHSVRAQHGHVRLGSVGLFSPVRHARRRHGSARRRQAMDVEIPASRRPPRDQRAARAAGAAGAAEHDLAGRDPQHVRAGLSA